MKERFLCLILIGILTVCSSNPTPLNSNELEAKEFVRSTNDKLYSLNEKLRFLGYEDPTDGFEIYKNITDSLSELVRQSKQFDSSQFKDNELKYIFEKLALAAHETIVGNWWLMKILTAVKYVEGMGRIKNIANFKDKKVKLAYFPDIENLITYTNNSLEVRYYWKEWREHNSDLILKNIITITDGILETAKATGISPLEYWMRGFNITEMEHIMNETQPLYLQLHGFIRSHLNKRYGDKIMKPNGVIPDHLFRQVIAQTWTNASIVDEIFPLAKLPPYEKIIKQNNNNALELFKSADRFYKSLGFDSLPENYWGSEIMINRNMDKGDCKPSIFNLPPKVYLLVCHKMDFRTFLQAHRYMGQIYYAQEMIDHPVYFNEPYDLDNSVGEAAMLSASTFGHLKTIGLLNNFDITEEVELNRLLRMGFHTLLNIPQHFVHSKVMADFFAGKVELGLLNKHYWKLMDQYVGVGPPMNRLTNTYDFPYKFYININENEAARKFNSEIFGYQFYKKLCQISGKYSKDNLHNCDFFGSKDVGDALKKMMKLGSSKRKNKVLETIFPENPKMSSDGLLEYYSPLKKWLTEKNREANVGLGWTRSNKTVKRVILDSGEDYDDG